MREIKFRAWQVENKKMINAFLWIGRAGYPRPADVEPIYNYKVMQYTGLKDKNGREIYEGDILSPSHREVKFGEFFGPIDMGTGFYTVAHKPTYNNAEMFKGEPFSITNRQVDESEVIGNIHQNPELLT